MPEGQTLAGLLSKLLPPKPTGPSKPLPQTLGKRPQPMTMADYIKAAILGGGMGMPSPYEQDYGYERAAAVGEGAMLGAPLLMAGVVKGAKTLSEARQGIKAYHGSPHDFEQFSLSKIGTGEGAQAYGHGLYFAENPEVATNYKLAGPEASKQFDVVNQRLSELSKEMEKLSPSGYRQWRDPEKGKALAAEYDRLLESKNQIGKTYEVSLNASPDDFLDWDKPLSQQSEKVRKAVEQIKPSITSQAFTTEAMTDGRVKITSPVGGSMGLYRPDEVDEALKHLSAGYMRGLGGKELSGEDLLQRFRNTGQNQAELSDALKKAGIKGIRYLDQGSRDAKGWVVSNIRKSDNVTVGEKVFKTADEANAYAAEMKTKGMDTRVRNESTSNYVVFDDAIIDIMKKYGLAFPAAAAMLEQQRQKSKRGEAHASAQ